MFTLNNPSPTDLPPNQWNSCTYAVWQLEKGANGTIHWQGYAHFNKCVRLTFLKRSISSRIHWEPRRGTFEQAFKYCTKEDTRQDGPFYFGVPPVDSQGKRNDLLALQETLDAGNSIRNVASMHFAPFLKYPKGIQTYRRLIQDHRNDKTFVGVIYGPTGCGKSSLMCKKFADAYWKSCGNHWWDDYDFEDIVIIDEYYGWLPYAYLLRLLDRYPMQVETKGGTVNFVSKQIWICSNNPPSDWYTWKNNMIYDPLERRIDCLMRMDDSGTLHVEKGANPFFTPTNADIADATINLDPPVPTIALPVYRLSTPEVLAEDSQEVYEFSREPYYSPQFGFDSQSSDVNSSSDDCLTEPNEYVIETPAWRHRATRSGLNRTNAFIEISDSDSDASF